MQALHDAILDALFNGGVLPEETIEQLLGDPADGDQDDARSKLEELIQQIIERMGEQGYITTPPDLEAERERRSGRGGGRARPAAGHVRSHRQDARLPRLPRAARSARLARQEQLRPARHARAGDRRRDDRRAEAVRVRRHAEPRRGEHAAQRGRSAKRETTRDVTGRRTRRAAAVRRTHPRHPRRSDGRPGRVSELVRHRADARLQPQHDPLRRGSLHAGQARGAGARAADQEPVSGRRAERRAVPRLGRGDSARRARPRARRARTTRTRAKACGWRAASSIASARTCGRSS